MAAGRGNFKGPLDMSLTTNLGKIDIVLHRVADHRSNINLTHLQHPVAGEEINNFTQIFCRVNRQTINQRPLLGIGDRQDQAIKIPTSRGSGHRQDTTYRLDAAIERELAHKQEAPGTLA